MRISLKKQEIKNTCIWCDGTGYIVCFTNKNPLNTAIAHHNISDCLPTRYKIQCYFCKGTGLGKHTKHKFFLEGDDK